VKRVHNFSAGPAALPEAVLEQARDELLDWRGVGASVMEISHRDKKFIQIAETAEADFRELLGVPSNYRVLFLQGGATQQFALLSMNLARPDQTADYVLSGQWGQKAAKEAGSLAKVHVLASSEANGGFVTAPDLASLTPSEGSAYVHITPNETIHGVEIFADPDFGDVPVVADVSSNILSRPINVSKYGVLYAGAQKNIGPSGLVLMVIREDLLTRQPRKLPAILDYAKHAAQGSMLNTPPTFAWYMAGLVFQWVKREGGLAEMARRNAAKADKLYAYIDGSGWYSNRVDPRYRSRMNVPFFLPDAALDADFVKAAEAADLFALKGHRDVGGMRASLYNAVSEASVDALIAFMRDYAARRG
jgi:phosphoserine aminotransferase